MSDIPPSIIFDILSRLPVKSLCRFKCVSKHWFALINSRRFSQKHLSTINKKRLLIQDDILSSVELETISSLPDSLPEETDHPGLSPDVDYYMDPVVVGSCNGLVCIAYLNSSSIMDLWLFNPSTRESKQIMDDLEGDVFGFGYEEGGDDYKVVKLPSSENEDHEVKVGEKARVYSLRNDSWEDIESDFELSFGINMTKSASVNGAIHSVAWYDDGPMLIVAFDLVEGKFKTVPPPPQFLLNEVDGYELSAAGELDGCLCLSILTRMSVELWVLKSYNVAESWQKIFAFESVFVFDMQPLCCMDNDGTILVRVQFNTLMFWDPKEEELKRAKIDCFDDGWNAEGIYMESVVSPIHISECNDEDKDLLEYWFQ